MVEEGGWEGGAFAHCGEGGEGEEAGNESCAVGIAGGGVRVGWECVVEDGEGEFRGVDVAEVQSCYVVVVVEDGELEGFF